MQPLERRQVLAYRVAAQGLHREVDDPGDLAVLDLGVQDTPPGAAAHALAIRLGLPGAAPAAAPGLSTTWSLRGAPHVHRVDELVDLSKALWPWSDADALARLDTAASPVRAAGLPARQALRLVAEQIADIVTEPMAKGEVSTALTPRLPAALTVECRRCEATHVVEPLWRSAVLPAGMTFDPTVRTVTFVPLPGWPGVPDGDAGAEQLVLAYLRLLGPATAADVAAFIGTTTRELASVWPDELAAVDVDGRETWIPEDAVAALAAAPEPPAVRLLPPSDPLLQARDREWVVPDRAERKALWPILGRPGAVLVHGEIVGVWRARKKGRRLDVTIQAFDSLPAQARASLDEEAELAAHARGATAATLTLE